MASSSTSSLTSRQWKYDVFISFRGADVRDKFLSHLFHALSKNHIDTFMDENLERGEEISPALLRVIEESNVALIIFSENYADSPWCLDELVKIVDCKRTMGQIAVPIFYDVDPTDVQELTGSFGEAFKGLIGDEFQSKTESWSNALRETAEISGFDSRNVKPESKLIEEIVNLIHQRVNNGLSYPIDDGLIGIDARISDIKSKLRIGSKDVWFLGIWGMGGIGKTTIARKIYDQISSNFEGAYFVSNIRERLEKYTLDALQHEILSKLLGKEISNSRRPSSFICKWITRKKVLIVLDDVSDPQQLEVLIGKHDMYGAGSRVIMTSRDKQTLMNGSADEICEVEKFDGCEALQLFSLHAFKERSSSEEYIELAKKVVAYANGIPLALKVLGSALHNKSVREWEDQLEKLKVMVDKRIQNILKISFDDLDCMEQEIFLDIACFFKWEDRHHAESILQGCGFHARIGIGVLLNKALITISGDKLDMHDLLQQMGRDIVREKCIEEPWKCSRLWVPQDIYNVLTKDLGEISVKSISLDMCKTGDINLASSVFTRMKRLQLLRFHNPYYREKEEEEECSSYKIGVIKIQQTKNIFWHRYSRGVDFLPDELRYLYWYGYPSKSLPSKFCPNNLVQLHLIRSRVKQLCIRNQCFESLKLMDLSYSVKLIRIADLSKFPKLEVLHLRGCTSLVEIRSTRLFDSELRHLNLQSCRNLCNFSSFLSMERLDFLSLEGCLKITEFPVIPRTITCLILGKTSVKEVPLSIGLCSLLTKLEFKSCTSLQCLPSNIGELPHLELLNLEGCSKLMNLPDSACNLKSLKSLSINECQNLKELLENIGNLQSLEMLVAARSGVTELPSSINCLGKLEKLDCAGCRNLILPPFTGLPSLTHLFLDDCGLSEISGSVGSLSSLSRLSLNGNDIEILPETIKHLSNLKTLYLNANVKLKCIPQLPLKLEELFARNCPCLESILSLSKGYMDFLQWLDVSNCFNLGKSMREKIMDEVLLRVETALPQLRHVRGYVPGDFDSYSDVLFSVLAFDFSIAGGELPERMKYKNENGSNISVSMGQYNPLDFIVVAFSAVVASTDYEALTDRMFVECESCFVTESGRVLSFFSHRECLRYAPFSGNRKPDNVVLGNVLFWVCKVHLPEKHRFTKASFKFYSQKLFDRYFKRVSNVMVKKCGVHLLSYDRDEIDPYYPFIDTWGSWCITKDKRSMSSVSRYSVDRHFSSSNVHSHSLEHLQETPLLSS